MNENLWTENTEQTEVMEPTALAEREPFPAEHALLLGKYLPILFWILIATAAVGLVTKMLLRLRRSQANQPLYLCSWGMLPKRSQSSLDFASLLLRTVS